MLAGVAMEEAHEYTIAIVLLIAGAISVAFAAFHWQGIKDYPRLTKWSRIIIFFFGVTLFLISPIWIINVKGNNPWSRIRFSIEKAHETAKNLPSIPTQPSEPIQSSKKNTTILPNVSEKSSTEIKLIFKNSPLFTPKRWEQITSDLNAFRNYLLKVGFDLPKKTPPLGITSGAGMSTSYVPYDSIIEDSIQVPPKSVDDPSAWRTAYCDYMFSKIFNPNIEALMGGKLRELHKLGLLGIFHDYFPSSYINDRPKNIQEHGWVTALWEIRTRCGQEFVDRALFYVSQLNPVGSEEMDFNKYFFSLFYRGMGVIDNNYQNSPVVLEIFKKHKLKQD